MSCRNSQGGKTSIRFSAISKKAIGGWRRHYGSREAPAPSDKEAQSATARRIRKTAEAVNRRGAGSGPRSRARRFTLAGFLFSPRARTKAQFNGVGRLRTYISFTHSVF